MEEYKVWLKKAEDDLNWAQHSFNNKIWYGACFAAHQSAEKSLKAFLLFHHKPIKKIHDLSALLALCIQKNSSCENLKQACATLSPFYIATRYPLYEDIAQFSEDQALQGIEYAKTIFDYISTLLHVP
ncbi:MAG: HEPN domain-containing protein [Patescibacteria group bacterium]|nr:HEPN domain-containing protein [Patescibacteria group bacterium]